jgi:hypothetical protein
MTTYIVLRNIWAKRSPTSNIPLGKVQVGTLFEEYKSLPGWLAIKKLNALGKPIPWWLPISSCKYIDDGTIPPLPPVVGEGKLYWTLHPFPAEHDGIVFPARPDDYPVPPNTGSFDVYSRAYTLPSSASDGGGIKVTGQQWDAILKKNNYDPLFVNWAVRGTDRIMMWGNSTYPIFHYPIVFGGNLVERLSSNGRFACISMWPAGRDVPDDMPEHYWMRCWCVYRGLNPIRDAPIGEGHIAKPAYMLRLGHTEKAYIYDSGLMRVLTIR